MADEVCIEVEVEEMSCDLGLALLILIDGDPESIMLLNSPPLPLIG